MAEEHRRRRSARSGASARRQAHLRPAPGNKRPTNAPAAAEIKKTGDNPDARHRPQLTTGQLRVVVTAKGQEPPSRPHRRWEEGQDAHRSRSALGAGPVPHRARGLQAGGAVVDRHSRRPTARVSLEGLTPPRAQGPASGTNSSATIEHGRRERSRQPCAQSRIAAGVFEEHRRSRVGELAMFTPVLMMDPPRFTLGMLRVGSPPARSQVRSVPSGRACRRRSAERMRVPGLARCADAAVVFHAVGGERDRDARDHVETHRG